MKKHWPIFLSIALNLILLWQVAALRSDMDAQYHNLQSQVANVTANVNNAENALSHQLRELGTDAKLSKDYTLDFTGYDKETQTLQLTGTLTLNQWGADTQVTLLAQQGEQTTQHPMTSQGGGVYTVPLSYSTELPDMLSFSAAITTGGVTTREELSDWESVDSLLPIQFHSSGLSGPDVRDGQFILDSLFFGVEGPDRQTAPQVFDPVFQLYCDGALLQEYPAKLDAKLATWADYTLKESIKLPFQEGSEIEITFCCTDELGLSYQFWVGQWSLLEGEVAISTAPVDQMTIQ